MIDVRRTTDGKIQVVWDDGQVLFESADEAAAMKRAGILAALAKRRGARASSDELRVLFPPTAPEPLILCAEFALGAEGPKREDVWDPVSGTWTMRNVEVFREGVALKLVGGEWKELPFTADDVTDFVEAFAVLEWQTPVKITHSRDQAIVLDQLPTIARATRLYAAEVKRVKDGRSVLSLFADLEKVPPALYEAIRAGKFPQRSIEFWRDLPRPGEAGKRLRMVLKAISLLGDELPAVRGMPALEVAPATFAADGATPETAILSVENKPVTTPNPESKGPEAITLTAEQYEALRTAETKVKSLESELAAQKDRMLRLEIDRRVEGAMALSSKFRTEGKITPAQEPYVVELLKTLDDEKRDAVTVTLSTKDGSKDEKLSARGAFVRLLESLPTSPHAPGAPQTRGDRNGGAGAAGFLALSTEEQRAKVAALGEKYLADKAKGFTTALAAYEQARKDLDSGAATVEGL